VLSGRGRVLVVDDDVGTVETFTLILRHAGYDVVPARDVNEGLSILRSEESFRLVLLDLRVGAASGLEVLGELQSRRIGVPAVMMSAWWTDGSRFAARRLGAIETIDKPLDAETLLSLLHEVGHGRESSDVETAIGYAASRWARDVAAIVQCDADVQNTSAWAHLVAESLSTLKARCAAVNVTAGDSLDLARLCRVIRAETGRRIDWPNRVAVIDSRTLAKLLRRGGLASDDPAPTLEDFLLNQELIRNPTLLAALRMLI